MKSKKIFAKLLSLSVLSVIIASVSFTAVSCSKNDERKSSPASVSATTGSSDAEKDITTDANKKLFGEKYATPYYLNIGEDFDGKITSKDLGDQIFRCALNNNDFVDIEKYGDNGNYIIPQDVGDLIVKNRFDIGSVDHSKISCYNAQKNAYVVNSGMLGQGAYVCTVVTSIKQKGDIVLLTADFVSPNEKNDEPDYSKKLKTLQYTLKNSNGHYLYQKVETTWKVKQ